MPGSACPGKDSHPREEHRQLEVAEDQGRLSFPRPGDHMLGCSHLSEASSLALLSSSPGPASHHPGSCLFDPAGDSVSRQVPSLSGA